MTDIATTADHSDDAWLQIKAHAHEVAEPHDELDFDSDRLDFDEEITLLKIGSARIFRRAISTDAHLPDTMPDIETEAAQAVDGLGDALIDLNMAAGGGTDVHVALADWKEALSVG